MHILLLTDSYPPEIRSASHLMLDLAQELKKRGYRVSVATTWPRYNLDENDKQKVFQEWMNEDGIEVLRIKTMRHHNVNYIKRGFAELSLPLLFWLKLKKYRLAKPDVVIVYSPPLSLGLLGAFLKSDSTRFLLNVQDLFPQNAIDLGVLRNRWLIKFFRTMEKTIYRHANVITVHSEGNRSVLMQQQPQFADKFITLHNWVDVQHHQINSSRDFVKEYGVENKFIAVYAGIIGPSQHLDLILDVAAKVRDLPDLLFLIVGDGSEKARLQQLAQERGLTNVMFQPFVGHQDYPALLKICHVGLVCLSPQNKTPVLPGKVLGYMAAMLPVIAFLNRESDGHWLIAESRSGYSAPSDRPEEMLTVMRLAYENRDELKQMGQAGYNYAVAHYAKEICIAKMDVLLNKLHSSLVEMTAKDFSN